MFKSILLTAVLFLSLILVPVTMAATTVTQTVGWAGGFRVITLTLTADGDAGAVSAQNVDLETLLVGPPRKQWYFYWCETVPGAGALAPTAYTVTLTDSDGGTILGLSARSTSAKEYAVANEDLPNYWPVTGDLTLAVDDIGASNVTVIKLYFMN